MPFEKEERSCGKDYYKEVWKFMKETDNMPAEEYRECFGSGREVYDIYSDFESAKAVYDAYLKKKEKEIKPGDYVKVKDCKYSTYSDYDLLVIGVEKYWYNDEAYTYRCIARKRGVDPSLISKNSYIFTHLMPGQIEKTGKRCKNFNYAMHTLFEDC